MATYTSNYGWTKPSGSDNVDISVLNNNLDDQDSTIHDAFLNMAPPFSESSTYAVDDIVLYGTGLYKCHTAVVTPGSWTGSTNWQVYKLSEGGSGGGGTSNYNQLTNKPQINNVELSGNKTSSQLGLMASDGVIANPTGQTTGTLTALEVGGTKYAVPSGGTSDYTALSNKPSINNVTLSGNKTTSDLGISYTDLTNKPSLANVATSGSYADLTSKPQVNGVELSGNKTTSDLGIYADNVMMSDGVTSVEDTLDGLTSGITNVIAKSMFGGYSTYYRTRQASIDGIVDNGIIAPQTDDTGYFSAENRGTIVGYGQRQFVFGWLNTTKLFAWIVICTYDGIYVGRRANASAFTIKKISD